VPPQIKKRRSGIPTGNAGEYSAMGELLRRGFDAQLADRNAKGYDLLVGSPEEPKNMRRRTKVEEGSDNVFADIGLPNPDEALAKADVAREINRIVSERRLTQLEAGNLLGIGQPRVSQLKRGRLADFSLEKLIGFAKALR